MNPETIITRFLQEAFTDDSLAVLRADAIAMKVPFDNVRRCLVGHATYWESRRYLGYRASEAYYDLGLKRGDRSLENGDCRRMRRLVPLIDAEIARRSGARAEVIAKAREVVTSASAQSPAGTLSASPWCP